MDRISQKKRSWNMSRIKGTNTKPELLVRRFLFSKGIRYRIHTNLLGKPDLVIHKKRFCIFITANDTGETGAHQEGFYIPKSSYSLFFDSPGEKGSIKDNFIKIKWQDDFETESRAIYYGQGTRNEYRLTRFGRGFPFLTE